jgi:hypothetical protein
MPARAARESGAPTGASPREVLPIRGGDTRQALSRTIRALGIDAHYRAFGTTAQARPARRSNETKTMALVVRFSPWFPPRRITLLAIYSRARTQRTWWRSSRGPLRQIAIFPGVSQMRATLSMPLSWLRGLVGGTVHGASSHSCCSIPLCRHHFARGEIGNARHQHQTASGCEQSLKRCRSKRGGRPRR